MIPNEIQPVIILMVYLASATLLVIAHKMQETYSESGVGNMIEIIVVIPAALVVLQVFIAVILSIGYLVML